MTLRDKLAYEDQFLEIDASNALWKGARIALEHAAALCYQERSTRYVYKLLTEDIAELTTPPGGSATMATNHRACITCSNQAEICRNCAIRAKDDEVKAARQKGYRDGVQAERALANGAALTPPPAEGGREPSAVVLAKVAQNVAALVEMTEHAPLPSQHREVALQASEILRWIGLPVEAPPFCFDGFQGNAAYLLSAARLRNGGGDNRATHAEANRGEGG